jgi:hypothetical protein
MTSSAGLRRAEGGVADPSDRCDQYFQGFDGLTAPGRSGCAPPFPAVSACLRAVETDRYLA